MENLTLNSPTLQLQGLILGDSAPYPVFACLLLCYALILVSNVGMLVVVACERRLHQPMYLLFLNLPVSDLLGSAGLWPQLLRDVLRPPPLRLLSYGECVLQAFLAHMFGATSHTVLVAMAFDRYVAVCRPLSYGAVMSGRTVLLLSAAAWGSALLLVGVLLGLTVRLTRCRTLVANLYCDNAALFKLSCQSVLVNNLYGLAFTVLLFASSLGSVAVTYGNVAAVCLRARGRGAAPNVKALKTCASHLLLYLLMLLTGLLGIAMHRLPQRSHAKQMSLLLFHAVPATMNPIVYGVQCKEVRDLLAGLFRRKRLSP